VLGVLQDAWPAPGEIWQAHETARRSVEGSRRECGLQAVQSREEVEGNTAPPYDSAAARPTPSKGVFKPTRLSRGAARRLLAPTFYLVCPVAYRLQ